MTRRRINVSFGYILHHRRHQRVPQSPRYFTRGELDSKIVLPNTMCGPFCSVPPVGIMTVVFPASSAALTSVEVSLSRKTDSCAVAEFGAIVDIKPTMKMIPVKRIRIATLSAVHFDPLPEQWISGQH